MFEDRKDGVSELAVARFIISSELITNFHLNIYKFQLAEGQLVTITALSGEIYLQDMFYVPEFVLRISNKVFCVNINQGKSQVFIEWKV